MSKNLSLKKVVAFFLLLSANFMVAQTYNPVWSIPPYYEPMHPPTTPTVMPNAAAYGGTNYLGQYISNLVADGNGKPLFYIQGGSVFDSTGAYLVDLNYYKNIACCGFSCDMTTTTCKIDGGGLFSSISGYNEVCVVPNPANCKQFYIFTAGVSDLPNPSIGSCTYGGNTVKPNQFYPFYGVYDLTLPNANGNYGNLLNFPETEDSLVSCLPFACGEVCSYTTVTDYFNVSNLSSILYPHVIPTSQAQYWAAGSVVHGSGGDYNLVFQSDGYYVSVFKLTGTGSSPLTLLRRDSISASYQRQIDAGEMEVIRLSNKNFRVAVNYVNGYSSVHVADYDSTGTPISGSSCEVNLYANTTPIHGIEFTPDGANILISHESTSLDAGYLYYAALSTPLSGSPSINNITGSGASDIQYSQIECNYQSSTPYMYFKTANTLASLNVNGTPSSWTTWNNSAVSFSTTDSKSGITNSYLLPDQMDGAVYYGSGGAPKACCLYYNSYNQLIYSAQGTTYNQTWNSTSNPLNGGTGSTATIAQELRIPAGYTVTINNMTLKFSPQARCIVENGYGGKHSGKLVLSGCTLTVDNRCYNDMWPGIQVWGNPLDTLSGQSLTSQGWLQMTNNTVIENAYTAVLAGYDTNWASTITPKPPLTVIPTGAGFTSASSAPWGGGVGGAIIYALNTTFLNNQRSLVFESYTGGLSSYEKVNNCTFSVNSALLASGVTPVDFIEMDHHTGNIFYILNSSFNDTYYNHIMTGIYGHNSACYVSGTNNISNMKYGMYCYNDIYQTDITCQFANFNNNHYGIYFGNVDYGSVENNNFYIYNSTGKGNEYGLYLDNCTGYYVQDNNFTRYVTGAHKLYGILVNNSGAYSNAIFRNSFSYLYDGSQAQYRNYLATGNIANGTGLMYLCNTFASGSISNADIYVPQMGSSNNVSTYTGTDTASGIGNAQGNLSPAGGNRYSADNQFSHTSSGKDFYIESGHALASNYTYYSASSGACGTTTAYYPAVINAAKLGLVCNYFEGSTPPSCSSGGTGHRTGYQNPLTVALSNAASNKQLYDSLNIVLNNSHHASDAQSIRNEMNNALTWRHLALDEAIRILFQTTTSDSIAWAKQLMKTKAMELPARSQVQAGIDTHDSVMMANALAQVAAEEGQSNFVKIHTVLLQNMNKSAYQIMQNPSNKQLIQQIAQDSSDRNAYLKANMLLRSVNLSNYIEYIQPGDSTLEQNNVGRHAIQTQNGNTSLISESSMYNQPNPFGESTTIQVNVVEKAQNAYVVVTDLLGAEIARYPVQQGNNSITIQAGNLNQSVMFCTLIVDGAKIATNKMVMMK